MSFDLKIYQSGTASNNILIFYWKLPIWKKLYLTVVSLVSKAKTTYRAACKIEWIKIRDPTSDNLVGSLINMKK